MNEQQRHDRALAALTAAALGDALGMPTQDMSRADIRADYGTLTGFVDAGPRQRIAPGAVAGTITDDTDQLLIVARLLVDTGTVDPHRFAAELTAWQDEMIRRGSADLLGPSTNAALERIRAGVPLAEVGTGGTTNGAAMRVAPVGIVHAEHTVADGVVEASALTHNTAVALAAAGLVAGTISAGVDGADRADALAVGLRIANACAGRAPGVTDLVARAQHAERELRRKADPEAVLERIGTSVAADESIPAAFALAAVIDDPWDALLIAARAGGDTDTVASIAGAMIGATTGMAALPDEAVRLVTERNHLDLEPLASGLLARRTTPER